MRCLFVISPVDEYGNYIEHSNGDVLLSIGEEDNSSFFSQPADGASKPSLDRNRKNLYCSGAGFSVGFGVEVGAGPLSAGGENTSLLYTYFVSVFCLQIVCIFTKVDWIMASGGQARRNSLQVSRNNYQ